jgi:hypothetical protein
VPEERGEGASVRAYLSESDFKKLIVDFTET